MGAFMVSLRQNVQGGIRVDVLPEGGDLRDFMTLPKLVYRQDAYYSATGRKAVISEVRRAEFHGRQRIFLSRVSGSPSARCVARISPTLKDQNGAPYGMLGFFEALNDVAAVRELFEVAVGWLRENGVRSVMGPMNGDTWHKYRLSIGPFDDRPFLMEPYNPDYYPDLWKACGFETLESYHSLTARDVSAAAQGTRRIAERAASRGYTIRRIDMNRFREELGMIYDLTCRIFADNFLYTDISKEAFLSLYDGVNALLDPDLVSFAQSPQGEDVGFLFALPDNWRAVAAMQGRKTPLALLKFLCLRGRTDTVNIKTLGVVPEYQRTGVAIQLMNDAYNVALRKGFRRANLCLIRDGNPSGRMDGGQGQVLRRYALYQLTPGQG